jgi:hypothetical protein
LVSGDTADGSGGSGGGKADDAAPGGGVDVDDGAPCDGDSGGSPPGDGDALDLWCAWRWWWWWWWLPPLPLWLWLSAIASRMGAKALSALSLFKRRDACAP